MSHSTVSLTMLILCLSLLLSNLENVSAWDSQGSCDGCPCDIRQSDQGGTVTRFNSALANISNGFLWSENRKNGLLVRTPDFEDSDYNWLASSSVNVAQRAPNPNYKSTLTVTDDPMCPSNGHQCEDSSTWPYPDCSGKDDKLFELAELSLVYGRHYAMNDGHDGHLSNSVTISGCYPTDANSVDKRNKDNGLGCHPSQYYGCTEGGKCISRKEDNCKCNYDVVPGVDYGNQLVESFKQASQGNTGALHYEEGGGDCFIYGEHLQPSFVAFDYASCYYTPDNTGDDVLPYGGSFRHMIEAQNTLWQNRDQLLSWNVPLKSVSGDISYWGWNECAASYKNGKNLDEHWEEVADAILIILPPMDTSSASGTYSFSLCDLSDYALDVLLADLKVGHQKGWGSKPVLIMEQTSGMDLDDCAKYWDNSSTTCGDGYRKGIFSQNYHFKDGSCLLYLDGDGEVYFYNADQNTNDHWEADQKICSGNSKDTTQSDDMLVDTMKNTTNTTMPETMANTTQSDDIPMPSTYGNTTSSMDDPILSMNTTNTTMTNSSQDVQVEDKTEP